MKLPRIALLFCIVFTTSVSYAQSQLDFHNVGFNYSDSFEVANKDAMWLTQYDMTAWITSDSIQRNYANDTNVIKRLGKEWFCYVENGEWHAVYGNNRTGIYDQVLHYVVKRDGSVTLLPQKIDTGMAQRYSRAILLAVNYFNTKNESLRNYNFNCYIRSNRGDTLQVWLLPAIQSNSGLAMYGIEANYIIEPSGKQIVKDLSYHQDEIKGYKPNKSDKVLLLNLNREEPTIGALFFAWNYKRFFQSIVIKNKNSFSMLVPKDGKLAWALIPQKTSN